MMIECWIDPFESSLIGIGDEAKCKIAHKTFFVMRMICRKMWLGMMRVFCKIDFVVAQYMFVNMQGLKE